MFMRRYFGIFVLCISLAVVPASAGPLDGVSKQGALKPIRFGETNKVMSDLLLLQQQIAVLERLVEREGRLKTLAESYSHLDLDFNPAPPSREVCDGLPQNLPCAAGYPLRFPDMQGFLQTADVPSIVPVLSTSTQVDEGIAAPEAAGLNFVWEDVRCNGKNCLAIVQDLSPEGQLTRRVSVTVGDVIAELGQVRSIDVNGVKVETEAGDVVILDPAPLP